MFRASLCPSSGALAHILLHMVFNTWCAGWCLGEPESRPCALCRGCYSKSNNILYTSVSQPPGHSPVPGPDINYTGPREVLLEFVILVF